MDTQIIRCNNCMKIFDGDEELEIIHEKVDDEEEFFQGCPDCQTDVYLMDIEEE